jgi:hypothetical protein
MTIEINYVKNKNNDLFSELDESIMNVKNIQNYIPLYKKYFSLSPNNFNSINLNHKYHLKNVSDFKTKNIFKGTMINKDEDKNENREVFCKFSPIIDPLKYLTGKYKDISNALSLPDNYDESLFLPKITDENNFSYVDGFFSYLSSQLLNYHGFINGLDFYGSFLAMQQDFNYNIEDDIEYLCVNEYFLQNKDKLFYVENKEHDSIFNEDSRRNKKALNIVDEDVELICDDINKLDCFEVFNNEVNDSSNNISISNTDITNTCIYSNENIDINNSKRSNDNSDSDDDVSSDEEESDNEEFGNISDEEEKNEYDEDLISMSSSNDGCSESNFSIENDEEIFCTIKNFPIQLINIEKCENTLDYLMSNKLLDFNEWRSCLFQIIMTLTTYQKVYNFTHNDLHSNNIMYINTEKENLYYCYDGKYYKVPTYGKIYKIIDFGRAIYKFNNKIVCSDSFDKKGDAATQYNCEPYFNEEKPRLEPNMSFDLCRLACCLFDYFIEDFEERNDIIKHNKIAFLVNEWLKDDNGKNLLYKNNGEERYPEFKLYKMIARIIHNAVPKNQINNELFNSYQTTRKKINKKQKIINIDNIPCYC